jgi:protein-glutamine gamma-glutamyltransferase
MSTMAAVAMGDSSRMQQLAWIIGCLALAAAPHLSGVPVWIPLFAGCSAAWRLIVEARRWRLPPTWLRSLIAVAAMLGVLATYRTLNGLEAGSAFLLVMGGMKLLETHNRRDMTVVVFVAFFLLFASFLYDQTLLRLPYLLVSVWLLATTLMRIHHRAAMSVREALSWTGRMLLQALPVALLLFLFFPRLPGQFWSMPARSSASTGLNGEMSPGDVSELSISDELAFRAKFTGRMPAPDQRYWRGPVLQDFDGRTWRTSRAGYLERRLIPVGPTYDYRIVLQPHQRAWVFGLDAVTRWPPNVRRNFDYQLLANAPIATLTSFNLTSSPGYRSEGELPRALQDATLRLPANRNPRSLELARELRATSISDEDFVRSVLDKFRNEKYFYTLEPPRLQIDSVDDFLFNTRRGFCEHFASAFTVLARAAGIPARVVTGYQGGEINPMTDYVVVRQSDAHAWAEVWLRGRGWVRVDPTAAVAPERITRGRQGSLTDAEPMTRRLLGEFEGLRRARLAWDAVNTFWNDQVVSFNEAQQRSLLKFFGLRDLDWRSLGVALVVCLATFFAVLSLWLAWRFRPHDHDAVARIYRRLCRKLARRDLARAAHEGPSDYLQRIATQRPQLSAALEEIRELYVGLRYGPDPQSVQLRRLKTAVRQLRVPPSGQ